MKPKPLNIILCVILLCVATELHAALTDGDFYCWMVKVTGGDYGIESADSRTSYLHFSSHTFTVNANARGFLASIASFLAITPLTILICVSLIKKFHWGCKGYNESRKTEIFRAWAVRIFGLLATYYIIYIAETGSLLSCFKVNPSTDIFVWKIFMSFIFILFVLTLCIAANRAILKDNRNLLRHMFISCAAVGLIAIVILIGIIPWKPFIQGGILIFSTWFLPLFIFTSLSVACIRNIEKPPSPYAIIPDMKISIILFWLLIFQFFLFAGILTRIMIAKDSFDLGFAFLIIGCLYALYFIKNDLKKIHNTKTDSVSQPCSEEAHSAQNETSHSVWWKQ